MAVFFRVEDVLGYGMYMSRNWLRESDQSTLDVRRPTVPEDVGKPFAVEMPWPATRFGFKNLAQMAEWIQEVRVLDLLIARGFRIGVYVVTDDKSYLIDRKQARFDVTKAGRRGHLHLDTIRDAVRLEDAA